MTLREMKEDIVRIAKKMYRKGMVNAFEGNISMRAGDKFLITPSQMSKELMTADMIIELDANGMAAPDFGYKPSSEYRMHLAAYALRPDITACVHNHSAYAASFALTNRPIPCAASLEAARLFGEIPLCAYGRPGTDAIFKDFPKYLPDHDVVLLSNHGLVAVGGDMSEAYARAEAAENLAMTLWLAERIGELQPLPGSLQKAYGSRVEAGRANISNAKNAAVDASINEGGGDIKERLAEISRALYRGGLINMFAGSVSARSGGKLYITPARVNKETITAGMIVELDANGGMTDPDSMYQPSSELTMHLAAYSARADISAVVHTHSPYATAHALCGKGIATDGSPEAITVHGEIPCLPFAPHDTEGAFSEVAMRLAAYNTLLLGNHGVISVGPSLVQAFSRAEGAESLARTLFLTRMSGTETALPADEIAFLRENRNRSFAKEIGKCRSRR